MSETQSLTVTQVGPPAEKPRDLLEVIAQAVTDPRMDVEKMRALFELQRDIQRENAKIEFMAALARLQAKLPAINKDGRIMVAGLERSRYAKLEDIDVVIRPLLAEEGFSLVFDEEEAGEHGIRFVMTLCHQAGHCEAKRLTVPVDKAPVGSKGPIRTAIQDAGSTVSYARRYLIKMHLNLIEKLEDNDGQGAEAFISEEQIREIETAIHDTKSNRESFLKLIAGVPRLEDIQVRDLPRIWNALNTKRTVSK